MFSLQRLLGKDEKFFDLLEASAQQVCTNLNELINLLKTPDSERSMEKFKKTRSKDKQITEAIGEHLCKTFVTPLEREDIESLSDALYRVPKTLEKFIERLYVFQKTLKTIDFTKQIDILSEASELILQMVKSLRQNPSLDVIKEQRDRLMRLETEGDRLMLELLRDMFTADADLLQVIILRDLHDLLERAIDRCRDAGNVLFHIVLKNS